MKRAPLPYANGGSLGWPRARSFCSTDLQSSMSRSDMSGAMSPRWKNNMIRSTRAARFGFAPLGGLRSGALSSGVDKLPGGIGFGGKNCKEAIAIDVDE